MWTWVVGGLAVAFGLVVIRGAPYVPSQRRYVRQAFTELYPLGDGDILVDVGSGDGIVLRLASEFGARGIGYELNPILVIISRFLSRSDSNVSIKLADFWLVPIPDETTIVYAFAATIYMKKMIHKMQQETNRLGRPLRFISYGSQLNGREADGTIGAYNLYTFYPLHVPEAQV
ncbi:MAG: hypothetical protein ABI716_00655 [Candidatus Saccharibacteria bacterium]